VFRLIDRHSNNMEVAARGTVESRTFGQLSQRVAILHQSFSRRNMISILFRLL